MLVAHHQNVTLGKGAAEGGARFDVDRLGEVEPNDFRARVIRQGRDGEGHHGLLPAKSPRRSPAAAEARCSVLSAIRVAGSKPFGRSLSLLVKLAYIQCRRPLGRL